MVKPKAEVVGESREERRAGREGRVDGREGRVEGRILSSRSE